MDPFRLLSRSTKLSRGTRDQTAQSTPSSGRQEQSQLYTKVESLRSVGADGSKKRKRGQDGLSKAQSKAPHSQHDRFVHDIRETRNDHQETTTGDVEPHTTTHGQGDGLSRTRSVPLEDCAGILKQHKVKIIWLNPPASHTNEKAKGKDDKKAKKARSALYPQPLQSFEHLVSQYGVSQRLANNIADQAFDTPTEVQLGALPLLLDNTTDYLPGPAVGGVNLLTVAPTGSGKTLAFILPLLRSLQDQRRQHPHSKRSTSVLVMAPTKELTAQIVNEGRKLARGTGITISRLQKGMSLEAPDSLAPQKESDDETDLREDKHVAIVKADILVSTPGLLQSTVEESKHALSQVRHLVLDEADVLLDPLFRAQTLDVWNNLSNPCLRVSMWSATMGSNIEELARSTIDSRQQRLNAEQGAELPVAPLLRLVVGLKDSAIPNVQHKLIYAATEQGKLMGLRQLLHPTASSADSGPQIRPPFLVFTQTIERAIALHSELLYDIPAEAGGISRIAVLHANLSDTARDGVMTRLRKGEVWVLITTDLLSRGVDFRGINGVVNYDIPTSSAAYVHRVGRTGRAGREGGVAVTLYSKEDIPYLKHVVNVVSVALKQRDAAPGTQQWLLDAVPALSKNKKQDLRRRGIEARTAKGMLNDPKAARKARISSKAGFARRVENNRKGAISGSRSRFQAQQDVGDGDESDFSGFG